MNPVKEHKSVTLKPVQDIGDQIIPLPASKSESNRALIIQALANGNSIELSNLAEARDTQTMIRLLADRSDLKDVLDAGTTMRFLTAYYAISDQEVTMTGTPRMCQRPIGILVDALREIGADINYLDQEGYPPLLIKPFTTQQVDKISIRGDVSSQYISALLMIAPKLSKGLSIELTGTIGSRPYIEMTLALMSQFGVKHTWEKNTIYIPAQSYQAQSYAIEGDWSGASYWFSLLALAKSGSLFIQGLKEKSLQGDAAIVDIMSYLGIKTAFKEDGILLEKIPVKGIKQYDFLHCPDIAQTVAVTCAGLGLSMTFSGLESLRIKETDRIAALQAELSKVGAKFEEKEKGLWHLTPSNKLPEIASFETYDDHRMAMAFASLGTLMQLDIADPEVVNKSYPSFWQHLAICGFEMT